MDKRILCIWIPNWPCQRVVASDPSLRESPLVLQTRDNRRGLVVVAANTRARNLGIAPGMSMSEATSLHRNSATKHNLKHPTKPSQSVATSSSANPNQPVNEPQVDADKRALQIREHDAQEDLEALSLLAESAQQFSPIVGLESLDSRMWAARSVHQPQGLLLDVTGIAPLFGGDQSLGDAAIQWLKEQGFCACVAIANSVGAAWALANYANRRKIAALPFDMGQLAPHDSTCAPDDSPAWWLDWPKSIVVSDTDQQLAVRELPVEALRIETATVHSLKRLGIAKIRELADLPREGLASRLGQTVLNRIDQAMFGDEEPIASLHCLPDLSVELNLEYPTTRRDTLEEILRQLVLQLVKRMDQRGIGALRLICRFDAVQKPSRILQLGLFRASADATYLTPLLLGQLEMKWNQPVQIHRVLVQATLIGPLAWNQPDLFQAEEVVHRDSAARLIDSLSNRLGRRAVVAPKLQRDPQPELACEWRPLTGRRLDGGAQNTKKKLPRALSGLQAEPSIDEPLRRPLYLIQPPTQLDVIALYPDGIPCQFRIQQSKKNVVRYWGPERIESGWWRGPSQRRDYYRVETDDGKWLWIFREINEGHWFLHGEFD
jgi:protein ImuB